MKGHPKFVGMLFSLVMIAALLASCAQPQVVEKVVTQEVKVIETIIVEGTPQVVEKIVQITPTPEMPQVGGKLVIALTNEPPNLDLQVGIAAGEATKISQNLGATLLALDPTTGEFVGYLAESWEGSDDGLVWTFKLRDGVKFHNGEPLTAQDFVYTIQRVTNPDDTALFNRAARVWAQVDKAEAVDALTLKITLKVFTYPFLLNMTRPMSQPLNQKAVEAGEDPVGVGPFKFKEYIRGEKLVLERYEDFNWGPSFTHGGPAYIENLEYRFVPEAATVVAGLEAGEIDIASVPPVDVAFFQNSDKFIVTEELAQGIYPYIAFNFTQPPFDDVRVRKAINLAVDRESLLKVVTQGKAEVEFGPISKRTIGYWPGVQYIGYGFDLAKAKSLMEEAGYTTDANGMLVKDGQPVKLVIKTDSADPTSVKTCEVLKEQFKALGIELEIQQEETGVFYDGLYANDFSLAVSGLSYFDADLMYLSFHSSQYAPGGLVDPELDAILDRVHSTVNPEARQKAADEAQKYIIENALLVPLFTPLDNLVITSRLKNVIYASLGDYRFAFLLFDAYLK